MQLYKQHFAGEEDEDGEATADGEDDGKGGSNRNKRQVTRPTHTLLAGYPCDLLMLVIQLTYWRSEGLNAVRWLLGRGQMA